MGRWGGRFKSKSNRTGLVQNIFHHKSKILGSHYGGAIVEQCHNPVYHKKFQKKIT